LKLLVEHSGRLVTKQQVLDKVWSGTFVTDAVLKDCIRQLRDALRDDAKAPQYIETAHRRGYRFVAQLASAQNIGAVEAATLKAAPVRGKSSVPLLGRDSELANLHAAFARADAGERQFVFVTGEAGIGKSTLMTTLLNQLESVPRVRMARGQCIEQYGQGEAYMPVLDGFTRLVRDDVDGSMVRVLRRHAPAWLAQMASAITPQQILPDDALGATRERMLREMAGALEALTADRPLVVVLEDLHWSDYSTLELISYLARRRDPARLLIIATYRPVEVILREHPLKSVKRELQAQGLCSEIALGYLSEQAIREYLSIRFPQNQFFGTLARLIHERTEGNPLFMVNVVQYLLAENWLVQENGTWTSAADISSVASAVPDNVRALIEKQIERLTADERAVLEAASVAGMECSSAAIAAGLDMSTDDVEQHCEQLAHRHHFLSPACIVELPDGTVTPRRRFNHVVYLDVAYSLIAPMRRAQIHQRIAVRGMEIYRERTNEIATELAMHFEQSRDWTRAMRYLAIAAQNATHRSAHHEASALARRGLELLKLVPESAERAQHEIRFRIVLGASLMILRGFASAEVEEVFAPGRALLWSQGPSPELFHMLWSQGVSYQFGGDLRAAFGVAELLLDMAQGLSNDELLMEAHRSAGAALVALGRPAEALEHLDQSAALYVLQRKRGNSTVIGLDCKVLADCFAAIALFVVGASDEAQHRAARGVALARELRHNETLIVASHFAANVHLLCGNISEVGKCAQEALQLAEEYGYGLWCAYSTIELGWVQAEGGDENGIVRMREGLTSYEATGARLWSAHFLGLIASQLLRAGRVEEGLVTIQSAFACAERTGERFSFSELHRIKGELLVADRHLMPQRKRGKAADARQCPDEAQSCFAGALAVAQQQRAAAWEARVRASMQRLQKLL
jgi:DNA-binding winged helix-turn-helix (wHTH) protein/tetratricopeptide (TPR) repeat protein